MIAIETQNLTRRFNKVIAVSNLNLKIEKGSLFGLIGPNGAGKTTTLRMLSGLLEPTNGQIIINNQIANHDWHAMKYQIGYMPDFFGVYEDMLVWEYLDFFARCYDLPRHQRMPIIDELLDLVDLSNKRNTYIQTLSRGMRQRLCLAHALVHDPQVLLLDEPASGLDPRARVEMRELLRELGKMGKTVVVSSHILAELAELCDSIGIIEKGQLIASGRVGEIKRKIQKGRTYRIKTLTSHNVVRDILETLPNIVRIFDTDEFLEIEHLGDEQSSAMILETLVSNQIRVFSFSEITSDLEEIFLQLTKGEVI